MVDRYRPQQHTESGRRPVGRPRVRKIERKYPKKIDPNKKDHNGRPLGSPNKISERIRAAAAASGQLPHEFALEIMRKGVGNELVGEFGKHTIDWEDVKWAVQLAAPYYAARMANIRLSGHDGGPVKVFHLDPALLAKASPQELDVLEKFFMALTGQGGPGHPANGNNGHGPVLDQRALPAPNEAQDIDPDDDYEKTLQ